MRQFFSSLTMRVVLALLLLTLLAVVIWWFAPLLSFGSWYPLAALSVQLSVLLIALLLILSLLLRWPLHMAGMAALCLLIWHAGPLLAFGAEPPLAAAEVRIWVIAVLLLVYLACGLWCLYRAVLVDRDFVGKLFGIDRSLPGQAQAEQQDQQGEAQRGERIRELRTKFQRALQQLASMRGSGKGLWRLMEGKRYLYDLPWYLLIGNSGVGKTTALHNAGMQFPLAGCQRVGDKMAGTSNCDWSFSNQAVFIDTAGRYALPQGSTSSQASDGNEWQDLLTLLRKYRPRAPVNGIIVVVSVPELAAAVHRPLLAQALRARLLELRSTLGIRFPVYVMVTQTDLLPGFTAYFQSLTSEGRAQVWGCSLPEATGDESSQQVWPQLRGELELLSQRLRAGVIGRLQEEYEEDRRRLLLSLPVEFDSLCAALQELLESLFQDSRFDYTQADQALRGVYFTSALQDAQPLAVARQTPLQRLRAALGAAWHERAGNGEGNGGRHQQGAHGYFLHDLFARVIIPEAHLVRPNLRWEWRFRMIRLLMHTLCLSLFAMLSLALWHSHANNLAYLEAVEQKTAQLREQLAVLYAKTGMAQSQAVPDVLTLAHDLPQLRGLDLNQPGWLYGVGLYVGDTVATAADISYTRLQENLLLPQIQRRMETVLRAALQTARQPQDMLDAAIGSNNDNHAGDGSGRVAYETLRVYLQLHDKSRYNAADLQAWVLKDWQTADSAAVFGARAAMLEHLERLFSGPRVVQSAFVRDEELVRQAREFLSADSSTQRLYERAKDVMQRAAPPEFSLARLLGSQAGTLFARASGSALDHGVPGLFTYEGYHQLFDPRLREFVAVAQADDAWVMGRETPALLHADAALRRRDQEDDPLTSDIRRQYLREYAAHWQGFLDDIRIVSGTSLGFDLNLARALAAPDSPLTRLARAAARETTLSQPLLAEPQGELGLLEKAQQQLGGKLTAIKRGLGVLAHEQLERELVDQHFAALREVLSGAPDAAMRGVAAGVAGKPALENIAALIDRYYAMLVVADVAINAGSLPSGSRDAATALKLEASKLPAPLRQVLTALADGGAQKIAQGAAAILSVQARIQFDRIGGLLALQVSDTCKRSIEGRYPFAGSKQDVSIDDFTRIFAAGGAADEFFDKQLMPFVETSVRPWRYKQVATEHLTWSADLPASMSVAAVEPSAPSLSGELLTMLGKNGPNPEAFAHMQAIRAAFFREPGSKKMAWTVDLKVVELDPAIVVLTIDIDGQSQRYVHGPVQAQRLSWPGPRGGSVAQITATPGHHAATSVFSASGPWALFRLLDQAQLSDSAIPGKINAAFDFDGRRAVLELSSGDLPMPVNSDLLRGFNCPGSV